MPLTATTTGMNNNMTQQHPYQRQYSHVYYQRLSMLGPLVWKRIHSCYPMGNNNGESASPAITHTTRILELPEDTLCSCVGTLIVERDLTPQPMEDDTIELVAINTPQENCTYYLEDESGRVALNFTSWWKNYSDLSTSKDPVSNEDDKHSLGGSICNDTPIDLCTGVVIGLVGVVGVDGIMHVQKVFSAATVRTTKNTVVNPFNPSSVSNTAMPQQPYVLLLSGLDCGSPSASTMSRDMLISYIQGAFPHDDSKAASIVHVIIAGGLVYNSSDATLDESAIITTNGCRDLDIFCYQIAKATGVPISIIPGQYDPTTANWPQRPLHASLIPVSTNSCGSSALVSRCPNPYAASFVLDQVEHQPKRYIFGTDGANVADWMKQSKRNRPTGINGACDSSIDELQALHATLAHQHICPTGPDTVPTAPHVELDPMVMTMYSSTSNNNSDTAAGSAYPALYFAGNCSQFQTKLVTLDVHGNATSDSTDDVCCRLICIPKFNETSIAVLVNLSTLKVELLKFDASTEY
jgi:DNA polymerase delta subunit 2